MAFHSSVHRYINSVFLCQDNADIVWIAVLLLVLDTLDRYHRDNWRYRIFSLRAAELIGTSDSNFGLMHIVSKILIFSSDGGDQY